MATASASKARERVGARLRPEEKTEIERASLTVADFIIQNVVANAR